MNNRQKTIITYLLITIGSALYAASTVLFIFPLSLLLGGTSGISVILNAYLPYSPGTIITVINVLLIFAALIVLGKSMALKTLVGSTLTTIFITLFEMLAKLDTPPIQSPYLSAVTGATIIAIASGIMFYVDSSSGGTDIIALIVKKFTPLKIGKALLVTDFIIVVVGGILSGWVIAVSSFIGFLVKTLGIDAVIHLIKKSVKRIKKNDN